ncbi:radical SAM protein [Bacillus sp. T3]|uniref:radical SAM protein n=1 Tax=Bacillus sp. T3 TaxID=467262 RepID=UPI003994E172
MGSITLTQLPMFRTIWTSLSILVTWYIIRSVFKYGNLLDPLPYKGWLQYPNTALLTSKGCTYNCLICGGSRTAYDLNCNRKRIVMKSPQKMLNDIALIQRFSRAPIFLLNDIRQGGPEYVNEFLSGLKKMDLKNEIVFELFQFADEKFFKQLQDAIPKYSIELTLETSDENLRRLNGKLPCTNKKIIETLQHALNYGCAKIDLFFMVGIPGQNYQSALDNIAFCEEVHKLCNEDPRLAYFVAPLSPFLDPGSPAFENPDKYGYKKIYSKLEEFRQAMLQPSWKYMLSYETDQMTREEIVKGTYDSALLLNQFKLKYGLIDQAAYDDIETKITKSLEFIDRIDGILELPEAQKEAGLAEIKREVIEVNRHSICGKNELKWETKKLYANFASLTVIGMELLIEEMIRNVKCQLGKVDRHKVTL